MESQRPGAGAGGGLLEPGLTAWHRSNALPASWRRSPGIGPITATALVASIGDAKNFANGRQPGGVAGTGAQTAFIRRQVEFAGD